MQTHSHTDYILTSYDTSTTATLDIVLSLPYSNMRVTTTATTAIKQNFTTLQASCLATHCVHVVVLSSGNLIILGITNFSVYK